jgi:hypothetical protein
VIHLNTEARQCAAEPYTFRRVYHDFLAGTPFEQEEFDDGSLFVFDAHCHFGSGNLETVTKISLVGLSSSKSRI